jgi:hypothetical protein
MSAFIAVISVERDCSYFMISARVWLRTTRERAVKEASGVCGVRLLWKSRWAGIGRMEIA